MSIEGNTPFPFVCDPAGKQSDALRELSRRDFLRTGLTSAGLVVLSGSGLIKTAWANADEPAKKGPVLKEVMFYEKLQDNKIKCLICPRVCVVSEDKRGYCGNKENRGGSYYSLVYGKACSAHIDPIEKKPFFHFLPGTKDVFSLAAAGCNFECQYCQNWQISQAKPEDVETDDLPPEKIVEICQENNCPVIAFTYTEPTVFYEYVYETARLAKEKGIASVMVSNGFINEKPLLELCKQLTAVKIDLKGFSDDFYKKYCRGQLQPVLDTLLTLKKSNLWYEIVVLVVPTLNDAAEDLQKMCEWINKNLSDEVPVHFDRFTPLYKLTNLPPTPVKTLETAYQVARKAGLKFVYLGNVTPHQWESTYCPKCEKIIIKRNGYVIEENNLKDGKCKYCQTTIPGYWTLKNR